MYKPKLYLFIVILGVLALVATACVQPTPPEKPDDGTIIIYVTDASPDEEITSILVTLSEVQVHKVSSEQGTAGTNNQNQAPEQEQQSQDEEGEWVTIDISGNATFDLLLIKGIEQFLGTGEVEATKYTQVRLVTETVQMEVGSGNLTDATLPSKELKIVQPFNVIAGETTTLVLDFEADKMVTLPGAREIASLAVADKVIVKPVVKLIVRQGK